MHNLPLLTTVGVALVYALVGGVIARRLGLPTIVGYLVAGVALGPFTPGFHGDFETIRQLAELGVILLMFGVGLHFSISDLWHVRGIAIPGALSQMLLISLAGYWLGSEWGWSPGGAWLLGISASVASTVVLMRSLMDEGLLHSPAGRAAVGWSIVEDLATVGILVLLTAYASANAESGAVKPVLIAVGKAIAFLAVMLIAGARVLPYLLGRIANTRSRELFVLIALSAAVGTALGASALFGVSLALGAFIAGLVVSDSPFSHQVSADLLPFREAFAVLFFVSVGMLVNPHYLAAHWGQVLALSALIIVGKSALTAITVFLLPHPVHTALVVAAGRAHIGEFSFIIGQSGLALGLLSEDQYSLILAGAIVSITVNPILFRTITPIERWLKARPALWRRLDRHGVVEPARPSAMQDHVVIIGSGRVGRHIAEMLGRENVQRLVVESDPLVLSRLQALKIPVLYGDAANSEILRHAGLQNARLLVITVPDYVSALAMVATAKNCAPDIRILARASSWEGGRRLTEAGVHKIVRPELEGGVELLRQTLQDLHFSEEQTGSLIDLAREEAMGVDPNARTG
ncbi:MAG: sodium:proton exchanger [Acidobacteria bacterium]|nr:MAG: sodium:proton exchanger [Acidobacteriota bacterium]